MKKLLSLAIVFLIMTGCNTSPELNEEYNADDLDYDDGYEWAQNYDIDNFDDCQNEFGTGDAEDGCNEYVKENYSGYQNFYGYECTEDCSGHEAGYEWAEENDIYSIDDCGGNSNSFIEGCESYVEENYGDSDYSSQYNPFEDRWESAHDNESLNYNAFEDDWEYTFDNEFLEYNAFEDEWQFANDNESLQYNAFEDTWEYASDDASLDYDPFTDTWSYY